MTIKSLFKKTKYCTVTPKHEENNVNNVNDVNNEASKKIETNIPEGMWEKCEACGNIIYRKELEENSKICKDCGKHFRMSAKERIELITDKGSFQELFVEVYSCNPLNIEGYDKKIEDVTEKSGINEAVVCGKALVGGKRTMIAVMDSRFLMGSMGSAVGEKITRLFEKATEESLPAIIFTASGGARMQEGIFSLMQMAKISAAITRHSNKGNLYITVITDPTTGGVTASFASIGDIIIGEKGALIGFAGRRVIEQTIKQKLPDNFQTVEFMLEHGFIDKIVERKDLKSVISKLLKIHTVRKVVS